jgi:hypothetical protein
MMTLPTWADGFVLQARRGDGESVGATCQNMGARGKRCCRRTRARPVVTSWESTPPAAPILTLTAPPSCRIWQGKLQSARPPLTLTASFPLPRPRTYSASDHALFQTERSLVTQRDAAGSRSASDYRGTGVRPASRLAQRLPSAVLHTLPHYTRRRPR